METQKSSVAKELLHKVQNINVQDDSIKDTEEQCEVKDETEPEESEKPANQDISDMEVSKKTLALIAHLLLLSKQNCFSI